MLEIYLSKPSPGATQIIRNGRNARIVCDFFSRHVTITHVGEDLVFNFNDTGRIIVYNYFNSATDTPGSPPPLSMKGETVPVAQLRPLDVLRGTLSALRTSKKKVFFTIKHEN